MKQGNWHYGDGGDVECEVLPGSVQTVQCDVLTGSVQTVQFGGTDRQWTQCTV